MPNISNFRFHAMVIRYLREDPKDPLAPLEESARCLPKRPAARPTRPRRERPRNVHGPVSNGSPAAIDPDAAPPPASAGPDAAGGSATERDKRRHQRAVRREGNGRGRDASTRERVRQTTSQPSGASRRRRLVLGKRVSVGLIATIVVGLIVGAILGALGAPGWVIGLLVASLTVILARSSGTAHAIADIGASEKQSVLRGATGPGHQNSPTSQSDVPIR